MSKWLALAETPEKETTPCDNSTDGDKTQPQGEKRASVPFCLLSHREQGKNQSGSETHGQALNSSTPDTDAFEERAAIAEFDGELSRDDAEQLAAQFQGYDNVVAFWSAFREPRAQN